MAEENKNKEKGGQSGSGNPGNLTGHGSGQQTSGKRGEKMNLDDKEGYHGNEPKKKSGNHGGNR